MRKVHNENLANGDAYEILKECLQCHRVTSLIHVEFLYSPLGKCWYVFVEQKFKHLELHMLRKHSEEGTQVRNLQSGKHSLNSW